MITQTMYGSGVGPYFTPIKCIVYNRTGSAVALGDVLMLDHLAGETESSKSIAPNTDIGGDPALSTSCWPLGNAVAPTTRGIGTLSGASPADGGSIFGVVTSLMQGAGADNTKVELTLFGVVTAAFVAATNVNFGQPLLPANGVKTLTPTVTAGVRILAKSIAPDSTQTSGLVLFNGLGFASALVAS